MIEKEYLASRVANANGVELVVILYEGFIDTLEEGIDYIRVKAYKKLNSSIQKAREILAQLLATLQGDSDIAKNLRSIYLYLNRLITEAENKRDIEKLQVALKVVYPIYEGWRELAESQGESRPLSSTSTKIIAGITYGKGQLKDYVVDYDKEEQRG